MAEEILLDGVSNQEFITSDFPFEDVRIHVDVGGVKVIHAPRSTLGHLQPLGWASSETTLS